MQTFSNAFLRYTPNAIVLCLLLICATRLAWVASTLETGWEQIRIHWQETTLGIGRVKSSFPSTSSVHQAEFWLDETKRIADSDPLSASTQMGAAWILDSPTMQFLDYMKKDGRGNSLAPAPSLDTTSMQKETDRFEDLCKKSCLQMAERATQLEPQNVAWWRLRALLLFNGDPFGQIDKREPRCDDWLTILDECKKHDEENSLYDYLAALQLWNASASYEMRFGNNDDTIPWVLTIDNPEKFELATERFHQGQTKRFLAIGERGYPSIADFLSRSKLSKLEQAQVALSRQVTLRQSRLFLYLWRWQNVRANHAFANESSLEEYRIYRQSLHLFDQAILPEETSAMTVLKDYCDLRSNTCQSIESLTQKIPSIVGPSEMEEIRARSKELDKYRYRIHVALRRLATERYPPKHAIVWSVLFSHLLRMSVTLLLVISIVSFLAAKGLVSTAKMTPALGTIHMSIVWLIGYVVSFVILGMVPAQVISLDVQRRALTIMFWTALMSIAALPFGFLFKRLQMKKFRFGLLSLFAFMTLTAIFASLFPLRLPAWEKLNELPSDLSLPEMGWSNFDAPLLRSLTKSGVGTWKWAVLQWVAHGGWYAGILLSIFLTLLSYSWRRAHQSKQNDFSYWNLLTKSTWSEYFRCVAIVALKAAFVWLLLYMAIAPSALRTVEERFQHGMQYCRDPAGHWQEISDAINESG